MGTSGYGQTLPMPWIKLVEGRPILVDVEEFRYTYKCGHCGHEWTEIVKETHREQ